MLVFSIIIAVVVVALLTVAIVFAVRVLRRQIYDINYRQIYKKIMKRPFCIFWILSISVVVLEFILLILRELLQTHSSYSNEFPDVIFIIFISIFVLLCVSFDVFLILSDKKTMRALGEFTDQTSIK